MELTINTVLAMFTLLTISSGAFFLAKKIRVPYTVLLVAIGAFILAPLSFLPAFAFLREFILTPELIFYVLLPVLIFESAYDMNIRRVVENVRSISVLSIVSLVISTVFIGIVLKLALGLVGVEIPYILSLLFGALISATDPVAVLALFKDFGAPRRLSLIFEGESIFNDGTAVALFLIVLEVAYSGVFHGVTTIIEGVLMFTTMVVSGLVFGTFMGGIFAKLIRMTRRDDFVTITLTVVLAHLTFILSELISHHVTIFDYPIHMSAIIATAMASFVMGNYGRPSISPRAKEFIHKFWGQTAFLANSLIFILIGLLFIDLPPQLIASVSFLVVPVIIAVLVVAAGRAFSIYPVVWFLNLTERNTEMHIPRSWQHLLAWGSLRGALAVAMVLLIPNDLAIAGWKYTFTPKEFIMALTLGCIFATLFIKATTIGYMMNKLGVNKPTKLENLELSEAKAIISVRAIDRIRDLVEKGYIDAHVGEKLVADYTTNYTKAAEACRRCISEGANELLAERALRLYAIGIERHHLDMLYAYDEVTERVYRRILGKLAIQAEHVERGKELQNYSQYFDNKDIFERMARLVRKVFLRSHLVQTVEEKYMYYRAQSIIARKVVKDFDLFVSSDAETLFDVQVVSAVVEQYKKYRRQSHVKMEAVAQEHPDAVLAIGETLARKGILKTEEYTINEFVEREMVTPKVEIALRDEMVERTA